jgi:hypothetical protein
MQKKYVVQDAAAMLWVCRRIALRCGPTPKDLFLLFLLTLSHDDAWQSGMYNIL